MGSSISMRVCLFVSDSLRLHDWSPPGSFCPWISQEEYGTSLPFPLPGVLHDPGMETASPGYLLHWLDGSFTTEATWEVHANLQYHMKKVITSRHFYESIGRMIENIIWNVWKSLKSILDSTFLEMHLFSFHIDCILTINAVCVESFFSGVY